MAQKRGLTYPLQIVNGRLALSEDLALVEDQIVSVLETRPFERVMRSDYGFDPKIFDTLEPNAINARISFAVEKQVPEVTNLEVDGGVDVADGGVYNVVLRYSVNGIPAPPLSLALNM
tara:strand:+ start:217 stop:570 length:354 start_codon:yes stop_codon:yes gene_type:complete